MNGQLRELLTNYGEIGGIWFDGWWDRPDADWQLERTYELIHELQPQALIGANHHRRPFPGEDFQMFEKDLPGGRTAEFNKDSEIGELPLETCETMNGAWGFNITDRRYKSTRRSDPLSRARRRLERELPAERRADAERPDPAGIRDAAAGDRRVDGEERRGDLRHARRPDRAAALGRHDAEGQSRLRPRARRA